MKASLDFSLKSTCSLTVFMGEKFAKKQEKYFKGKVVIFTVEVLIY